MNLEAFDAVQAILTDISKDTSETLVLRRRALAAYANLDSILTTIRKREVARLRESMKKAEPATT